ncbi:CDP-alcohol phosphatidyltransferase family protein [Salinispora vitiensis]|uniref:CDP-alcohol phosphatidyltransferase family protein n=1 Tax=Salinispora vitiensis TaxID=999544 RepID=UPI00037E331A|nr:CDP-alcohol phosphatidyltransferase family protein [Salinispora vitiensis]
MNTLPELSRPTAADFYRTNRGGGLFSETISQWIGAALASGAHRLGLRPTTLSITNLLLGLITSVIVATLAEPVATGRVSAWLVGLVALVGWQVAYALDCADGQLARVTGQGSPAGARVDVLSDVAAQIALVAALGATAVAQSPSIPAWLIAAFAGTWMVNLVTSVMQAGPNATSMVTSTSLLVRLVKLIRDYGAVIFVAALVLLFAPGLTSWVIVAFTAINGGFLLASIAFAARASLR